MGQSFSCTSKGALLLVAATNGDVSTAQELLRKHPKAAMYHNFKDKSSPLIQASARGHFELVQMVLEAAVMSEGPERAKRLCVDHVNAKRQSALMAACKMGHADCVEYLVTNGADPLLADERRHNTCLHFAALYGHSECVHKLLGSRTNHRADNRQLSIAQLPCMDEAENQEVKFVNCHNGWGLTALHIAVFQGSINTVRALLRHGASLETVITPSQVENSPIRCAAGSNALHIAALIGNIAMAKLILEAQEAFPGLELRSRTDAAGLRPQECAQRVRNPVLVHLLDERLPVHLLRQIWLNYSLDASMPPRHQTLGSMLQKLKLMFNLEAIAAQRNLALLDVAATNPAQPAAAAAGAAGKDKDTAPSTKVCQPPNPLALRGLWVKRHDDVEALLSSVTTLHTDLQNLCSREALAAAAAHAATNWPTPRCPAHEAVLDFILSTLITPRTVSAVLHAAKKLVCASVMQAASASAADNAQGTYTVEPPPNDAEAQHSLALLSTALRAVETCLHAATYLTNPSALEAAGGMVPVLQASSITLPVNIAMPQVPVPAPVTDSAATPSGGASGGADAPAGVTTAPVADAADTANYAPHAPAAAESGAATSALPMLLAPGRPYMLQPCSPEAAAAAAAAVAAASAASPSMAAAAAAAAAANPAIALYASHWSSHLHTLIAQLQWDIGVQRHRRRRQHAAAAAARAAAASGNAAGLSSSRRRSRPAAADPSAAAQGDAANGGSLLAPVVVTVPSATAAIAPAGPLRSMSSRRGDAPQDVLTTVRTSASERGTPNATAATAANPGSPRSPALAGVNHMAHIARELANVDLTPSMTSEIAARPSDDGTATPGGTAVGHGMLEQLDDEAQGDGRSHNRRRGSALRASSSRTKPSKSGGSGAHGLDHVGFHDDMGGESCSDDASSAVSSESDRGVCAICMDLPVAVTVASCHHGLCVQCAFQLTIKGRELPSCPFCRQKISGFESKLILGSGVSHARPNTLAAAAASPPTTGTSTPVPPARAGEFELAAM